MVSTIQLTNLLLNKTIRTMTKTEIFNVTENLVGYRFKSLDKVNERLSKDFGCKLKAFEYEREDCVKRDMPDLDDQLACAIEHEQIDLDLYYIKDNGNRYYITEVCFNYF